MLRFCFIFTVSSIQGADGAQGEVTWKQEPEQSTWKTVSLLTQTRGLEETEDLEKNGTI